MKLGAAEARGTGTKMVATDCGAGVGRTNARHACGRRAGQRGWAGAGVAVVLRLPAGRAARGRRCLGQRERRGRGEGGGAVLRVLQGREGAGLPAVQEVLKFCEQRADVAVDAQDQQRLVDKLRHAPGQGGGAGRLVGVAAGLGRCRAG